MKAIVVLFDSLNKNFLPCYGAKDVYAPNFERLAKKSIKFENSYVSSMPCIPARRELHTGRKNFLHKEWGPLEPFDDSMPEILKKNGIYSHLISNHIHYWEEGGGNFHTKYSSWEVVRGREGDHWKGKVGDPYIPENAYTPTNQAGTSVSSGWRSDWVNREYIKNDNDQPLMKVFDLGIDFIKENFDEDNWLLQIETFDPHEPFLVMDHYMKKYNDEYKGRHFDWPRGKVKGESEEEISHVINKYKAALTMCDMQLGRLLDLMDLINLWEDTLLIVGTDHGFLLTEHDYWGKNQAPYFNEVANTPLFIYDPRLDIKNETRKSLVQFIDWAPTILEFFNIDIPKDMEGKSLKDVLKDDDEIREAALYGVFSGHVNVTDGRYVYMRAAEKGKENHIYNYTLMPSYIHNAYGVEELKNAEFVDGFSFTKGLKVLKVPAKDKYGVNSFGNLLYDLQQDPKQLHNLKNKTLEENMINKLVKLMKENDAPMEQYERLGIEDYYE
ncbi:MULTISPECIES: sulfatase [Aerococcus]|uniref:Sulfatase n=1 Tax=Aerococcus urinae TaxID=1376 RepID=A0A2I1L696_9LACT|nr:MULTISPECIES: sulfatase [Aerococcus]KAA9219192.1 sulfatase [Aerococcus loyolae]KAA9266675.1 sulfatase [Aerococcus loyolae]MCY3067789.1 sulfatase [Aerococcus mictus]MCY3080311.1 sulfatase [Aerococcus mictus]MCY3084091.1 sulfatase [Aerococcus mictus]